MSYRREELSEEEERKLARRGACIATIIVPLLLCCVVSLLLSYTRGGRVLVSNFMLQSTYYGNFIGFWGFEEIAKTSCDLERQRPRPATHDEDQQTLETRYFTNLRIYRKYWQELKKYNGDTGQYPSPSSLPQTFLDAQKKYC